MKHNRGVTLIELLVTISIAVILMTVAVPGFQELMTSNRLSGISTEFFGSLNFAKAEAVKRGHSVSLCRSSDGTSCATTGALSQGRIVFIDTNGNGAVDGEAVLRVFGALPVGYTAIGTVNTVTFARNGTTANAGTIALCRDSDESRAQAILITRTRMRFATDGSDSGTVPEKEDGSNITSCEGP